MRIHQLVPVATVVGLTLAVLDGAALASSAARHSGTVVSVDPGARTIEIQESVEEGQMRRRRVVLAGDAKVIVSERIPANQITDLHAPFRERSVTLAELRPGDFVVVELAERGGHVARSVTVTLPAAAAAVSR
jgi:hypothetical protein